MVSRGNAHVALISCAERITYLGSSPSCQVLLRPLKIHPKVTTIAVLCCPSQASLSAAPQAPGIPMVQWGPNPSCSSPKPRDPCDGDDVLSFVIVVQHCILTTIRHCGLFIIPKRTPVLQTVRQGRLHQDLPGQHLHQAQGLTKNRPTAACRILKIDSGCQLSGFAPAQHAGRIQRPSTTTSDVNGPLLDPSCTLPISLPFRLPDHTVSYPCIFNNTVSLRLYGTKQTLSGFAIIRFSSAMGRSGGLMRGKEKGKWSLWSSDKVGDLRAEGSDELLLTPGGSRTCSDDVKCSSIAPQQGSRRPRLKGTCPFSTSKLLYLGPRLQQSPASTSLTRSPRLSTIAHSPSRPNTSFEAMLPHVSWFTLIYQAYSCTNALHSCTSLDGSCFLAAK